MVDIWWVRGEGGSVMKMSLPFGEGIQARVDAGLILRVNEDGSPWSEGSAKPAPKPEPSPEVSEPAEDLVPDTDVLDDAPVNIRKPKTAQPKDVWVAWAVYMSDLTDVEAGALTKAELIERFG